MLLCIPKHKWDICSILRKHGSLCGWIQSGLKLLYCLRFNQNGREIQVRSTFQMHEFILTSTPTRMIFRIMSRISPHHDNRLDSAMQGALRNILRRLRRKQEMWRKLKHSLRSTTYCKNNKWVETSTIEAPWKNSQEEKELREQEKWRTIWRFFGLARKICRPRFWSD